MKKYILPFLFAIVFGLSNFVSIQAQIIPPGVAEDLFCETFDTTANLWKMTRSNIPAARPDSFELDTIVTKNGSFGSATDTTANNTTSYLTTPLIDIAGYTSVGIEFDHICYVDQFDDAIVEYSFDKGVTWRRLPQNFNDNGITREVYTGNSTYNFLGDYKFSKASRPFLWYLQPSPPIDTFVFDAVNSVDAWVTENFDLTYLILRNPTPVDSLMIRFGLFDDPASSPARTGTHRWWVDNFCVRGADCELVPPTINMLIPHRDYVQRYEGRVYQLPPYTIDAQITDNLGIDTAYLVVEHRRDTADINQNPGWKLLGIDTIPTRRFPGNNFTGIIPEILSTGDTILSGDSIYWKLETVDKSDCRNTVQDPPENFSEFLVVQDLPKSCATQPVSMYPYYQTFDAPTWSVGRSGIFPVNSNWLNISGDFHDWWVNQGPTPTTNTGPSDSYPPGGKYLYVHSQGYEDSTAFLITPCLDFFRDRLVNGIVKFYLNMNTSSLEDTIFVDIFNPTPILPDFPFGRFEENVIPPVTGFKGDNWVPYEFSTFPYRNTITQIRFRGTPGNNSGFGDMALDSFKIVPAALTDLRLNPVDLAPYSPTGVLDNVRVNVQNLGTTDATSVTFHYQVILSDNTIWSQSGVGGWTWTGVLEPGESKEITTNLTYEVPRDQEGFQLKTWLTYNGDEVDNNDTAFSRSIGLANQIIDGCGYIETFDGEVKWSTFAEDDEETNKWELGTPNYGNTATLISPPNAWDINLNQFYTGTGITRTLISPFLDMRNTDSLVMSFLNNRDMTVTQDGVWIEYSLDRGLSWKLLLMLPSEDPLQKRWYNGNLSSGSLGGTSVLVGKSICWEKTWNAGWFESETLLPNFFDDTEEVLFRFNFFAEDDDSGSDGFSMDNFLVYDADTLDLEPQFNLSPSSDCDLSDEQRFKNVIKNRGLHDVYSFDIEYRVEHIESGFLQVKSETINDTIITRDTIHVLSEPTFDMFSRFGDYKVDIITKLAGDGCSDNDTLTKFIENIQGCSLQFLIQTHPTKVNTQARCDSSVWQFSYTNNGRSYTVKKAYNDRDYGIGFFPNSTIDDLFVCIKNGSSVRFDLNDIDTLVRTYSLIAFNGKNDTVISDPPIVVGGPDSPTQIFQWNCPPQLSVSPRAIRLDLDSNQLPAAKSYIVDVVVKNTGLDAVDSVDVTLEVGNSSNTTQITNSYVFNPPIAFNKRATVSFGRVYIGPGTQKLCATTSNPNGKPDVYPIDDTLCIVRTFMDTVNTDSIDLADVTVGRGQLPSNPNDTIGGTYFGFCEDFEGTTGMRWIAISSGTYDQNGVSFEKGTPSSTNINGAFSGDSAWVTNLDGDYPINDTSTILSPFFYLKSDSCYQISFMHNYYIDDAIHDGGQVQMTFDSGATWYTLGSHLGDTIGDGQNGWYNTRNILSIPDDSKHILSVPGDVPDVPRFSNSGWTGISNGWVQAFNTIRPDYILRDGLVAFRWRFHSDGSQQSDGWAIDNFCIGRVNLLDCFGVGIDENKIDKSKLFLGQNIPNPATNSTTIPYFLPKPGQIDFVVVNLLGQPVYEEKGEMPYGEGVIDLDVSTLSKGVYYYWLTFEGERITNKMIISK